MSVCPNSINAFKHATARRAMAGPKNPPSDIAPGWRTNSRRPTTPLPATKSDRRNEHREPSGRTETQGGTTPAPTTPTGQPSRPARPTTPSPRTSRPTERDARTASDGGPPQERATTGAATKRGREPGRGNRDQKIEGARAAPMVNGTHLNTGRYSGAMLLIAGYVNPLRPREEQQQPVIVRV